MSVFPIVSQPNVNWEFDYGGLYDQLKEVQELSSGGFIAVEAPIIDNPNTHAWLLIVSESDEVSSRTIRFYLCRRF